MLFVAGSFQTYLQKVNKGLEKLRIRKKCDNHNNDVSYCYNCAKYIKYFEKKAETYIFKFVEYIEKTMFSC